ncbi:MAG: hypothetical protein JWM20_507 [Patescibacteria group bacterium]|nr:hypothetical protein [Patescibacteria group bacterium]
MKKGIIVTEENMPEVLEEIKQALKGKNSIKWRYVYASDMDTVRELLSENTTYNYVKKEGVTLLSTKYELGLNPDSYAVEETFLKDKKFIAVRGDNPMGHIIYVTDTVTIAPDGIFIFKEGTDAAIGKPFMEVWQWN